MTAILIKPADPNEYKILMELFERMNIEHSPVIDEETLDWYKLSIHGMSKAYSDDEPEYTADMLIEKNPKYNPDLLK